MPHQFEDAVSVSGTRRTADGYLVATARCVRTGIQLYRGDEVGRPDLDIVRVYRDEAEVFAQDSLQGFSHAPVTNDHPKEAVTADNWKKLSVGEVSTAAKRDGDWVMLPLILKDAAAIGSVEAGKRELSAGYSCELDWTPGITADGQAYDAQQKNIKINHLALVDRARAGSEARIGDGAGKWGASPVINPADRKEPDMPDNLRKVMVDGLQVETTDAGQQAITKLLADRDAARKETADAKVEHDKALAAKDADLAKKDAEIEDLKKKVLDGEALDAAVQARAALIDKAKRVAPKVETAKLSDSEIRKAVVAAVRGEDAVKDKSDAYIDAAFDLIDDPKTKNPLTPAIEQARQNDGGDPQAIRDGAHQRYLDRLNGVEQKKEA